VGCSDIDVVERNWELLSLSVVGRFHFMTDNEVWHPYVALGIGAQEHHDGTQRTPLADGFSPSRTGTDVMALIGVGAQWDLGYPYLRAEMGARIDTDDGGISDDNYVDGYLGVEFILPIGPRPLRRRRRRRRRRRPAPTSTTMVMASTTATTSARAAPPARASVPTVARSRRRSR
jgi:hypothetical protein